MSDTAPETLQTLIAAGRVLASVQEPDKDLLSFACDLSEVALTIKMIGAGLERAVERSEDHYDAILKNGPRDFIDTRQPAYQHAANARDADQALASAAAIRTAKRALIDLSKVIGEMEIAAALAALRTDGGE